MRSTCRTRCFSNWWKPRSLPLSLAILFGLALLSRSATTYADDEDELSPIGVMSRKLPPALTMSGTVRSDKGSPVAGARVSILIMRNHFSHRPSAQRDRQFQVLGTAKTDAAGKYDFRNVAIPVDLQNNEKQRVFIHHWLIVQANGYALSWRQLQNKGIDFKLKPEQVIEGVLVNEQGKPWVGLPVRAIEFQSAVEESPGRFRPWNSLQFGGSEIDPLTKTDANGKFVLAGMPANHFIHLRVSHHPTAGREIVVVSDEARLAKIKQARGHLGVQEGQLLEGLKFKATISTPREVQFRLTYADTGLPCVGAFVKVLPLNGYGSDGEFHFTCDKTGVARLSPFHGGHCQISVEVPAGSSYFGINQAVKVLSKPVTEIHLKLPRGIPITGEVIDDATGKGVPQVHIKKEQHHANSSDIHEHVFWEEKRCQTDAAGKFSILVMPGKGQIGISRVPSPYKVPDFWSTGNEAASKRYSVQFTASSGKVPGTVRFSIGRGTLISGRILGPDKLPIAKARVFIRGSSSDYRSATTDAAGRYEIRTEEDPHYSVYAVHAERKLKAETPLALAGQPGQIRTLPDLQIHPVGTLRLKIVAGGKPQADAQVQCSYKFSGNANYHKPGSYSVPMDFTDGPVPIQAFSDSGEDIPLRVATNNEKDGTFVVQNLSVLPAEGMYELDISNQGETRKELLVESLKPGESLDLGTIELVPRLGLEVTVVDMHGKPVEGLTISHENLPVKGARFSERISSFSFRDDDNRSDKNGVFKIFDVSPAGVRLHASVYDSRDNKMTYNYRLKSDDRDGINVPAGQKKFQVELIDEFPMRKWPGEGISTAPPFETKKRRPKVSLDHLPPDTVNSVGLRLRFIEPGSFQMGSPETEQDRFEDELSHEVVIKKPFLLGKFEVTQAEFRKVLKRNPSWFSETGGGASKVKGLTTDRSPVELVTWFDAVEFCNQLSELEKLPAYYKLADIQRHDDSSIKSAMVAIIGGKGYRLPTEAEWEYACRAGTTTAFHFGTASEGNDANIEENLPEGIKSKEQSLSRTTSVGRFQPNNLGLHDMHGNVYEWCQDWYGEKYYTSSPKEDPRGPDFGQSRVVRGGSWMSEDSTSRAATRLGGILPGERDNNIGFRVARDSLK